MLLNTLTAISPIDGRYRTQVEPLAEFFSEAALIRYRVRVEVEYFLALAEEGIFVLPESVDAAVLRKLYQEFSEEDARRIKDIERTTNHDVKAVEYFLKEKLAALGAGEAAEWIHFGLTSQDVNNTAVPLLWKEALSSVFAPALQLLTEALHSSSIGWKGVPMLARTHGQPASPTTLGREWAVFAHRIEDAIRLLEVVPHRAKFGGATGGFNAHFVAFPNKDWPRFGDRFVQGLGLQRTGYTTQIEPYDHLAAQCDSLKRIATILIDFCRDIWTYISLDYFKQQTKDGEVGSSAMPHKVNPIDFENAEGNLGIAIALYEHFSSKLPISRLQRDLTDSTVLRNLGMPLAHQFLALKSIQKGLGKLKLNEEKLKADLEANWAVVSEAVQTILRREGVAQPYEALKTLTRGKSGIDQEAMQTFIRSLDVSDAVREELIGITPHNYVGAPILD
jgi:adenylosuccinate lyase